MKQEILDKVETIDLFCGIGGLSYGLNRSGLTVSKGFDIEHFFKYGYEKNNPGKYIVKDIRKISSKNLFNRQTKIKILVGCAPCQPFSTYTTKYKYSEKNSDKWNLLNEYLRLIKESTPHIISLENVPKLTKEKIFIEFIEELKQENYNIFYEIIDCSQYGIPQKRKRLVLLGSKFDEIELLKSINNKVVSVRETLKKNNLKKIKAGESNEEDFLHISPKLSPLNIKRIKASKPGGTWKDWDENLKLECHKRVSGKSFSCVYGRIEPDKPSPTLTTQFYAYGTGRFGHPVEDRALSLREGALLQTFPKNYVFCQKNNFTIPKIGKAIGNAVPPKLGEVIGKSIIEHLKTVYDK